jgi:lipopolysaccharide/colanic/teichoic acid biosynthesis glycosyltransferase
MHDDRSISEDRHKSVTDSWTTNAAPADARGHQAVWRQHGPHEGEKLAPPLAPKTAYLYFKVVLEYGIALVLFVLSIPVIFLAALFVKMTSRGPMFYSQVRLGKNGRPFKLHKIRSMTHNCEKTTGPCWSVPGDPRITPVGTFLRKTHLDELPQLWNVLRGEMTLVGPRPERPEFASSLEKALPHYRDRLQVLPGVTGLAQVQQSADTDLASVRRKLAYDLYYIRHMNLWLDLRLILCTAIRMLGLPFHFLGWLFWLPRREVVENHYKVREALAGSVLCLQTTT